MSMCTEDHEENMETQRGNTVQQLEVSRLSTIRTDRPARTHHVCSSCTSSCGSKCALPGAFTKNSTFRNQCYSGPDEYYTHLQLNSHHNFQPNGRVRLAMKFKTKLFLYCVLNTKIFYILFSLTHSLLQIVVKR